LRDESGRSTAVAKPPHESGQQTAVVGESELQDNFDTCVGIVVPRLKGLALCLASSPGAIAWSAGVLAFVVRLPFLFRYDLHFGGDSATCYLMALRITEGDRPLYFYGQDYQGATEAYVAALLLRLFGPSIPLAAVVSLLEWSLAVACGTYLAVRGTTKLWGTLAGFVAAIGVPYTLHYVTVPYWGYPSGLLVAMLLPLQA